MSTEALRKAVDAVELAAHAEQLRKAAAEIAAEGHNGWGNACMFAAEAIDTHRANYDALVIRLGEVTTRLEAADGLLRECLSAIDLHPVARASITTHLGGEQ